MRWSFTIGKVADIPIKIHLNWFITAVLVVWSLAAGYLPQEFPGWSTTAYWIAATITSLLFFGSVLMHELGHSLVALREAVPVNSITLFVFGGVAHIGHEPETPGSEFRIVAAGPLTSLALAVFFYVVSWLPVVYIAGPARYLAQINIILAVFNMIPGFPLDGGRILRSIFWKLSGQFIRSTRWASHAGLGIALLFVAIGLVLLFTGNLMPGLWLAFIGWYLSTAAQEGYRQATNEEAYVLETDPERQPEPVPAQPGSFPAYHGRLAFEPVRRPLSSEIPTLPTRIQRDNSTYALFGPSEMSEMEE